MLDLVLEQVAEFALAHLGGRGTDGVTRLRAIIVCEHLASCAASLRSAAGTCLAAVAGIARRVHRAQLTIPSSTSGGSTPVVSFTATTGRLM